MSGFGSFLAALDRLPLSMSTDRSCVATDLYMVANRLDLAARKLRILAEMKPVEPLTSRVTRLRSSEQRGAA